MTPRWQERAAVVLSPDDPAREPGSAVPMAEPGPTSPSPPGERPAARIPSAPVVPRGRPEVPPPVPGAVGTPPGRGRALEPPFPSPAVGSQDAGQADPGGRGRAKASARGAGASPVSLADLHAAAMTERELEHGVRALLADLPSLRWYHTFNSRRSPSGFPDLVIVGNRVIYRELKTAKGKVTDAQAEWLHALVLAEQDACVWRPADLLSGLIGRRLAALAGLRGAT